ncbi:MAG: TetR/AcrR family transcriptional regulator [Desulfotignum sp.]|nr:TetR/AcrR family transcriptional regulator [Desulfotignum sp.]MCF8113528.1 TetR/AcrR family transcriptional regulator [Desulfotignum sp.]MCF8125758.1 TetR/AcrR family transcriptional regulator [Desulfotignum sp.]
MKQTPFAKLKEKERKARQNLIVNAAERLFSAKPFPKVSMRDIADESGISLSSIYRYFPDQESLFIEALTRGANKIQTRLDKVIKDKGATVEDLAATFVSFLIENDPYFRMMTHFMLDGVLNTASVEKLNRIERVLLNQFNAFFSRLNPEGSHRLTAHAFFAALNGILITYRNYPGRDIEDVHKHMKQLVSVMASMFSLTIASGNTR